MRQDLALLLPGTLPAAAGLEACVAAHQQQQAEVEDGGEQQERARRVESDGDRALPREGRQRAQAHQREQHLGRVGLEVQAGG